MASIFNQIENMQEKIKQSIIEKDLLCKAIAYPFPNFNTMTRVQNPYTLFQSFPPISNNGQPIIPRIYFQPKAFEVIEDVGTKILVSIFTNSIPNRINSQKLNMIFTVGIHNSCIITDIGNRFNVIMELLDSTLNGNSDISKGFPLICTGVKDVGVQKEYHMRNLVYTGVITNTHNYTNDYKFDT